ncbi:glycosyltransferase involved in cell wall biosynthesis [Ochrobactrum sp. BH3]|nr:glycosyltransferase involved in cell wall biosynthesis [Ochrobactrum sp. BH3]
MVHRIVMERTSDGEKLLSVIVPVYNTERYVLETLQSIATSAGDDFEIVIVDDGSPDSSAEKILQWINSNSINVRFVQKENGGLGAARNTGAQFARGKYIAFLDSDDLVQSFVYRTMVDLAEANNLDLVLARAKSFSNLTLRSQLFGDHFILDKILNNRDFLVTNIYREPRLFRIEPNSSIRVFRKDFYDREITQFPEGVIFEDVAPHSRAIARAGRIGILNDYLLLYRIDRAGQITASKGKSRFDILTGVKEIVDSKYVMTLSSDAGANLCGQLSRLVHWCGEYCPSLLKHSYIRQFLSLIDGLPADWWELYAMRYSENERERNFSSLSGKKDELGLLRLIGGRPLDSSAIEAPLVKNMQQKTVIKNELVSRMMAPVRMIKYRGKQ